MAKKMYEEYNIVEIADAIRSISSSAENTKYKVSEMPIAIINGGADSFNRGSTEGYSAGRTDGYNYGYNDGAVAGYNAGYEEGEEVGWTDGWTDGYADGSTAGYGVGLAEGETAGKQAAYDEFWDNIQNYGERTVYGQTFSQWSGEYIRPKHKIVHGAYYDKSYGMYKFMNNCSNLKIIEKAYFDLSQVELPTNSSSIGWRQTFQNCRKLQEVEDIGMQPAVYYFTFTECYQLHTIEVLRFAEGTRDNSGFLDCQSLKNITIEGTIGQNLSFKSSPLSVASLKSVIAHLKDYTGTDSEYKYTITFKSSAFTALEESGFTDEDKAWLEWVGITYADDLTWASVIDNLKWNLTLA